MNHIEVSFGGRKTRSKGRNGGFDTKALGLWNLDEVVEILPVSSRDTTGACIVEVPKDPKVLRQVADWLRGVADEAERERAR